MRLDGLRLQLLGLVILPFSLILLAVSIAGVVVHEQAMRRLVTDRDHRVAQTTAATLDLALRERLASLKSFTLRLAGEVSFEEAAGEAAVAFDGGLVEIGPDGEIVAATDSWGARNLDSAITFPEGGAATVSPPFPEGDRWMIVALSYEDGAAAAGALSLEGLLRSALASSSSVTDSATVTLVDAEGTVLARVSGAGGTDDPMAAANQSAEREGRGENEEQIVARSPVADTGWTLVVEEPWIHITSPALSLSLVAPLVLIPALVLTLVGLGFGARRVIAPLRQLERQAGQLAEGDFSAARAPVEGIAEVQHLQRTMAWMAERIGAAQEALQNYIGAITHAQEDERRRLARELHDETIQQLIALDQRLQILAMDLRESEPSHAVEVDELHRTMNDAIQEVRRMTRALRPSYLEELGLAPALEMLASYAGQELGISVSFETEGASRRLSPEAELALYRIVQQALSNIGRHAQAKRAWVTLSFRPDRLTTLVRDDGLGFEVPARLTDLGARGHFGLMGMKERAELAGGSLSIHSSPGSGTRVWVDLPLPPAS